MTKTSKTELQRRLRRIEVQAVAVSLLDDHLRTCVADAVRTDSDAGNVKLDDAAAAIERLVRS